MNTYNVSRETYTELEQLVALLKEGQQRMNLVSRASLEDVWTRHIADSLQLFQKIPTTAHTIYDLGSGAGFPALVLAIVAHTQRPDLSFTLIESITKKTVYLNSVKEALSLENVTIINDRTEHLHLKPADVITARAVTALTGLLEMARPFCTRKTVMIFPKGKTFQAEVDEALKKWRFDMTVHKNDVSADGVILYISNLRRK